MAASRVKVRADLDSLAAVPAPNQVRWRKPLAIVADYNIAEYSLAHARAVADDVVGVLRQRLAATALSHAWRQHTQRRKTCDA